MFSLHNLAARVLVIETCQQIGRLPDPSVASLGDLPYFCYEAYLDRFAETITSRRYFEAKMAVPLKGPVTYELMDLARTRTADLYRVKGQLVTYSPHLAA
jgi:hypothetical protein